MSVIVQAVLVGMVAAAAGTLPRNVFYAANLRFFPSVPWAVFVTAGWLVIYWRFAASRGGLRANRVAPRAWLWSLIAGGLGVIALVLALHVVNGLVMLPQQDLPDLGQIPHVTTWALLIFAAPVAGIVEESAFRGFMQTPIERRYGLPLAIVITGTMFAVAHLDFTPMLWPYYVAVAAIYGTVTALTNSILPAIVLHTAGNIYSNLDLLLHGRAEWQAAASPAALVWSTGADTTFWATLIACVVVSVVAIWCYVQLAHETQQGREDAL